jgi:hypothetical protein
MTKPAIALDYSLTENERYALYAAMGRFVLNCVPGDSLTFTECHVPDLTSREAARAVPDYLSERERHKFVLTEKGAAIVQWWMHCGYHARCSEQDPNQTIVKPWTHVRTNQLPPLKATVTAAQMKRLQLFMRNGEPRMVRCYDNGGKTADRYTAVFTGVYRHKTGGVFWDLAMNREPFHPQGIGQSGESRTQIDRPRYSHLGKKVAFNKLPCEVRQCVRQTYVYLWDIHTPYTKKDK